MKKIKYNSPDIRLFVYHTACVLCASEPGLTSGIEAFKEESNYSGATNWY